MSCPTLDALCFLNYLAGRLPPLGCDRVSTARNHLLWFTRHSWYSEQVAGHAREPRIGVSDAWFRPELESIVDIRDTPFDAPSRVFISFEGPNIGVGLIRG